jgi:hypothetical protein
MASRRIRRRKLPWFGGGANRRAIPGALRPAERLGGERLEPRLALATDLTVALRDGIVRIAGTDGDDAIFVRQEAAAVVVDYSSGVNTVGRVTFPSGVRGIEVFGFAGRDLIVVNVGSLASSTVVDTGPEADLVLSTLPIQIHNPSGRDLSIPLVDPSLPTGNALTTLRIEKPNLTHEAVYSGQSLTASRTSTADGRHVEVAFDGLGGTVRDTFIGNHLVLSESWDTLGGYQRTVTALDGARLRETFDSGTLWLEEREYEGRATTTIWDMGGYTARHSIEGDNLFVEEIWDGHGGYRRTRRDDSGAVIEEVYDEGTLRLKTIARGQRRERATWDTEGNRVREVLVNDVLVVGRGRRAADAHRRRGGAPRALGRWRLAADHQWPRRRPERGGGDRGGGKGQQPHKDHPRRGWNPPGGNHPGGRPADAGPAVRQRPVP